MSNLDYSIYNELTLQADENLVNGTPFQQDTSGPFSFFHRPPSGSYRVPRRLLQQAVTSQVCVI